jgi:hypothetical protein
MDANSREPNAHGVAVEPDRVKTSIAVGLGLVLAGSAIVGAVLTFVVFQAHEKSAEKKDRTSIAEAGMERREDAVPPLPRLQVQPVRHWKDFHAAELDRLSTYGWMDRTSGAVHIPIDRAMDLVAERGVGPLAAMPPTPAPTPTPVEVKK